MNNSNQGPIFPNVVFLSIFALLFVFRVVGQWVVSFQPVSFLPPMEEWYSGLLPYPILLPIQIVIIVIMGKVVMDFWNGRGYFITAPKKGGVFLKWFSYIYFLSMVIRYIVTMWIHPERRWFTGTIPIWFHMVLASFLFTLSHHYLRNENSR